MSYRLIIKDFGGDWALENRLYTYFLYRREKYRWQLTKLSQLMTHIIFIIFKFTYWDLKQMNLTLYVARGLTIQR